MIILLLKKKVSVCIWIPPTILPLTQLREFPIKTQITNYCGLHEGLRAKGNIKQCFSLKLISHLVISLKEREKEKEKEKQRERERERKRERGREEEKKEKFKSKYIKLRNNTNFHE